jgi:protein-S-isoprenylcysteine O-methyltransferase Ste14
MLEIKRLVGAGDRIAIVTAPVLVIGVIANVAWPALFSVGGPAEWLRLASIVVLAVGVVGWAWSAALILLRVPKHELITSGPFAVVRHPLYTAVALLVLPWAGFVLDTWLGLPVGLALYVAARRFVPREEAELSTAFGPAWRRYRESVLIPWL